MLSSIKKTMGSVMLPKASIKVAANKLRVDGIVPDTSEGLIGIYIDDLLLTRVPLNNRVSADYGSFVFRAAKSLADALPAEYQLKAELPDGSWLCVEETSPLGAGDGSLQAQLDDGFMVSAKAGYLFKPPVDKPGWTSDIFDAYTLAQQALSDVPGTSGLFVAYGSLLGLVRDGQFIAHDDDFDSGFVVEAETPEEAAAKLHEVMDHLRAAGHTVTGNGRWGNFNLCFPDLPSVDMFLMYYRPKTGELCSYNLAHKCSLDMMLPLKAAKFSDVDVLIPQDAEAMLAATYGDGWATPDPYFQWDMTPYHDRLKNEFAKAYTVIADRKKAA